LSEKAVDLALEDLQYAVTDPTLAVYDIGEQLSVLSGRIPAKLYNGISSMIADFKEMCAEASGSGMQLR
jgi:hypothetical protein